MSAIANRDSVRSLLRRSEYYSLLAVAISIGAFCLTAVMTDTAGIFDAIKKIGVWTTIIVIILASCNYAFRIVRFGYLLGRVGFYVPPSGLTEIYLAGGAMAVTPGKLGEFIRAWMLRVRYDFPYRKTLPVSVADRAGDALAAVLLGLLSMRAFTGYAWPAVILSAVFLSGCVLLMRPFLLMKIIDATYSLVKIKPRQFVRLRQLVRNTSDLFRPTPLFGLLSLSCVGWTMECLALYFCASVFNANFTMEQAIFIFTFASLAGAISLIPGGVGGTEALMATLLITAGLTMGQAAAVTLTIRAGTLWFGVGCGYIALFSFMSKFYRFRAASASGGA